MVVQMGALEWEGDTLFNLLRGNRKILETQKGVGFQESSSVIVMDLVYNLGPQQLDILQREVQGCLFVCFSLCFNPLRW